MNSGILSGYTKSHRSSPHLTKCQKIAKTSQVKFKVQRLCFVEVALKTFSLSAKCLIVFSSDKLDSDLTISYRLILFCKEEM